MRLARYCAASFIVDGAFYILWTVVPFVAEAFDAGALQIGQLTMLTGAVYVACSVTSGWLSDRLPHLWLMRIGGILAGGAMILISQARNLHELFIVVPLASAGTGLFWPTIQAAIGREAEPARLDRALGAFNVSWSAGKSLGFLSGGLLLAGLGSEITLRAAAVSTLLAVALLPLREFQRGATRADPAEAERPSGFLRAAWAGNFAAFGVSNILNAHYPLFLKDALHLENSEVSFGYFLGAIFAAQTLTFAWLLTRSFWTYRWLPILSSMALMGTVVALVPWLDRLAWMLAAAIPIGLGLGVAYSASIFYSLHGPKMQGLKAGIHEGIIGTANVIPPFVGGWMAEHLRNLSWPYWTGAMVVGAALGYQLFTSCRHRTFKAQPLS
jgi:MFS family permease